MRKTTMVDEDGNEFPPPEPGSPLAGVIYLLEYGRKRGFRIGPAVQIGDITVQVQDLRQAKEFGAENVKGEPDIWAQHGHSE